MAEIIARGLQGPYIWGAEEMASQEYSSTRRDTISFPFHQL